MCIGVASYAQTVSLFWGKGVIVIVVSAHEQQFLLFFDQCRHEPTGAACRAQKIRATSLPE
jgi:hypothetical protein